MDEELELLFDPNPFIASIEKMKASFDNFANAMQKKDEGTQKQIVKTSRSSAGDIFKAFSKLALIGGFFVGIYRGVKGLVSRIPEIGMSFKIAGDIFYRNFLWPLRRMLIPMLNEFLRWVREHRVLFVQWGQTLVNIFIIVKQVISTAIKLIRNLIDGFLEGINKGTGKMMKNITEVINVTLFKIAMILAMISVKLEPIMKRLGEIFRGLIDDVKEFGKGFAEGFSNALKEKDFKLWERLDNILSNISKTLGNLKPLFHDLGYAIGNILGDNLVAALTLIDNLLKGLELITGLMSPDKQIRENTKRKIAYWFSEKENMQKLIGETLPDFAKGLMGRITGSYMTDKMTKDILKELEKEKGVPKEEEGVKDAVITKDGKIIRTDPQDTLIAMKNPNKLAGGISLKFDNIFNINVTEGNAKNAGESFGMGLMDRINFELKKEYKLQGN